MRKRRILIGLVVGVAVLGQAAIAWIDGPLGPEDYVNFFLFAMTLSHGSLLACWAALSGRATPWRMVVVVVGIVGWMWLLERFAFDSDVLVMTFLALLLMGLVSLLLLTARFFGTELTDTWAADWDRPPEPSRRWMQYSLRSLFSWMTAVAMVLAALHYLPKRQIDAFLSPAALLVLVAILGGSALIALSAVWLTLATRWTAMRHLVLFLAGVVPAFALTATHEIDEAEAVTLYLGQIFWTAGSLWLVRLAGYRLIWRRRILL